MVSMNTIPVMPALRRMIIIFLAYPVFAIGGENKHPIPKVVKMDKSVEEHQSLLGGPPHTLAIQSGLVVIMPGDSIEVHNTENYEEVLVILEGVGQMIITDGPVLNLDVNVIAYCPPQTEHYVTNTGSNALRYIYIVADTEKSQ